MKDKFYYKDGTTSSSYNFKRLHRLDGPAAEVIKWRDIYAPPASCDFDKYWYVEGKLHRLDGPTIEYANGCRDWYVEDIRYSKKDFDKLIKEVKSLPLALRLTDPREWVRNMV